jgi:hypothetical protein
MLNIIIKNEKSKLEWREKNADTSLPCTVSRSSIWARDGGRGGLVRAEVSAPRPLELELVGCSALHHTSFAVGPG